MYRKPPHRAGRCLSFQHDFQELHTLWYRDLCDLMEQHNCKPPIALKFLHERITTQDFPSTPATERQNFKLCWNAFIRTCAEKQPELNQYKLS